MLEDVNTGINWVLQKISHYGGDPEQVYLVGQSCGAQLCSLTTLLQVPPICSCINFLTACGSVPLLYGTATGEMLQLCWKHTQKCTASSDGDFYGEVEGGGVGWVLRGEGYSEGVIYTSVKL